MNVEENRIKVVTVSANPDMPTLMRANMRFAALMAQISEEPDCYRGMTQAPGKLTAPLDSDLSLNIGRALP